MTNLGILIQWCSCLLLAVTWSEGVYRYGDVSQGAAFPCRCTEGCDPDNGTCLDGGHCIDGHPLGTGHMLRGQGCRIGNVAYNKIATQKETFTTHGAEFAVDGNINSDNNQRKCAITGGRFSSDTTPAWWYVDLGTVHEIYNITLYNIDNGVYYRMAEFRIVVSLTNPPFEGSNCTTYEDIVPRAGHVTLPCTEPLQGRYVAYVSHRIDKEKIEWTRHVQICEFVAMGRTVVDCSHCPGACDDYTGCSKCPNGTRVPDCTTRCLPGWYGESCGTRCSEHCSQGASPTCNRTTGECTGGCKDIADIEKDMWWLGDRCDRIIPAVNNPAIRQLRAAQMGWNKVVLGWEYSDVISPLAAPFIGFQVYARLIDVSEWTRRPNVTYKSAGPQEMAVGGLEPETAYQFAVSVYRVYTDGTVYEGTGKYVTVNVTTTSETTKPPLGLVVGLPVALVLLLAIGVTAVILLVFRRKVARKRSEKKHPSRQDKKIQEEYELPDAQPQGDDLAEINQVFVGEGDKEGGGQVYENFDAAVKTAHNVKGLGAFVHEKSKTDFFKLEFESVPVEYPFSCLEAEKDENKDKNRYKNIKTYDETRVVLDGENYSSDSETDYINASYMTGFGDKAEQYVAAQAPTPHTLADFWRMIWKLKANRIVMLTKVMENGIRKCGNYWSDGQTLTQRFGQFTVTVMSCHVFTEYALRIMTVVKGETKRTVHHLQFLQWPDKLAPDETYPLLAFRRKVKSYDVIGHGPLVVHCSAGVGRTGTFIAIDQLIQQVAAEGDIDVKAVLTKMRKERSNVIQTPEQYRFVYEALVEATRFRVGPFIPCPKMADVYRKLCSKPAKGKSAIDKQFQFLRRTIGQTNLDPRALDEENIVKNRNRDIVAGGNRPFLSSRAGGGNDYINAVFVDTYKTEKVLIATQMPLSDTVIDFWRLIYDHKCGAIVLLQSEDTIDETCPMYWPHVEGSRMNFGPFEVTLIKENSRPNFIIREFSLFHTKKTKDQTRTITQFALTDWPQSTELPDMTTFVDLYDSVERWREEASSKTTVVQCLDGAWRCGLFCAATYMLQKMAADNELDVFYAVRCTGGQRSQFVESIDQYRYLHELAIHYQQSHGEYQNI